MRGVPGRQLRGLCARYGIAAPYALGSRAAEAAGRLSGAGVSVSIQTAESDVDIGIRPVPGRHLDVRTRAELAAELEDLFDVPRVDLVVLPEGDPFLAAEVVRGERLYARDAYEADECDLYVLRRAGDLAPLERERLDPILGEPR